MFRGIITEEVGDVGGCRTFKASASNSCHDPDWDHVQITTRSSDHTQAANRMIEFMEEDSTDLQLITSNYPGDQLKRMHILIPGMRAVKREDNG